MLATQLAAMYGAFLQAFPAIEWAICLWNETVRTNLGSDAWSDP
jgi:hypothetical protein